MSKILNIENIDIAIVGLGYVGLPLAVAFSEFFNVIGFDVKAERIKDLKNYVDHTNEVSKESLQKASNIKFTSNDNELNRATIFIITVPTPIDSNNNPDLAPIISATELISSKLKKNDIVIYESTVYPGLTEEVCMPILENNSQLKFNEDFYLGYSPERINPGDKERSISDIVKITSGSTPEIADFIDSLYKKIIKAGTHKASSIKVAEAAKVIENTQRDVNIALINELAIIFNLLGIETDEVLKAAGTKWNFLPFRPGLVGGHCIGVDPYYLTFKAQSLGYDPEIILSGRKLNDGMSKFVVSLLTNKMAQNNINVKDSNILIMGLTFKENCPDIRNTKVIDIYNELTSYGASVDCFDPHVDKKQLMSEYGINICLQPPQNFYDAIIIAVSHDIFIDMGLDLIKLLAKKKHIFFDLKNSFPSSNSDIRL